MKSVGVIIPCHNYGHYLGGALKSVLDQDYLGYIHTIVVNDGSKDNTFEVVDLYKPCFKENHTLDYYELPSPTGPSNARNIALNALFQQYDVDLVAFLDADDKMTNDKLSRLVPVFDDDAIGSVYADYYHVYPDGTYAIELKEIFDRERFIVENIGPNNTSIVTKDALLTVQESYGFFDPSLRTCEDYDLFLRISEKFPIKHVAEPLTYIRVHDNNSTNTVNKKIWQANRMRVNQKIKERMDERLNQYQ